MEWIVNSWPAILLFSLVTTLLVKELINLAKNLWMLPPGPWGLPIVGYVPWIGREAHATFAQLGRKYGGLFSVNLGGNSVVVLNDWPTIKATLVDEPQIFSGRPYMFMAEAVVDRKNVGFNDGIIWHKQKRLTAQCLRNIGMGKKSTESIITEIVHQLLDKLTQMDNQVVHMESMFFEPILKVNWGMVSGNIVSGTDDTVVKLKKNVDDLMKGLASNNPVAVFPWLRFLPPDGFGFKKFIDASSRLKNLVEDAIDEHIINWKEGFEIDLIDHYLTAIKRNEAENQKDEPPFNVDHLVGTIWDIFLAATDTVNSTCEWGFLYLACNVEVQHKAQSELDSVVGRDRMINSNDFPSLPYLDALTKEVHRMSSVVSLSLPHSPITNFHIQGCTIPKGTTCLQNIYGVHHDPNLWEEPHVFRPERFLDKDNKSISPPYLMPFSIGSRKCLGQSVAEMELKLIFGGLLQRFSFRVPADEPKPDFEPEMSIVLRPKPYLLHIKRRI